MIHPNLKKMRFVSTRFRRKFWRRELVAFCFFTIAAIAPQRACAHGELMIRIADVTRQIKAATNHVAPLYLERGELHREHLEWDAAESDYARVERLQPGLLAVDFCRAIMLDDAGRTLAAEATFNKVIARSPTNGEALVGRARVRMKLGKQKLAISDFENGLKLLADPKPEYFLELAHAWENQKRGNDALRTLDEGIARLGPLVSLEAFAVELELARKNTDAALARLDAIIQQSPRKEDWLARRGEILLNAGKPAEARNAYQAALASISILPWRLQQGPSMRDLQLRIRNALGGLDSLSSAVPAVASGGETRSAVNSN